MCEKEDNYNDNLWEDDKYRHNEWEGQKYNNSNEWEKSEEQNCNHNGWEDDKHSHNTWEEQKYNNNEWEKSEEQNCNHSWWEKWDERNCNHNRWEDDYYTHKECEGQKCNNNDECEKWEEQNCNHNGWEDDNYSHNQWEEQKCNNNEWEKWEEQNCNHNGWEEKKRNDSEWEHEQHNYNEWEQEDESSLGRLYRPPYELMYKGDFHQAKADASLAQRFLLLNLQAKDGFSSQLLNRDTWSNVAVAQTIKENFVFWQVSDHTTEGMKVKTYYNLAALPAILVLNPITGEKMKSWCGIVVEPETLLENLIQFMETTPSEALRSRSKIVAESSEHEKNSRSLEQKMSELSVECREHHKYPPLPEEARLSDGSLVSRVRLRFPDGHRVQRNFFRTDPIQLLWSLCKSELMWKDEWRPFQLIIAVPGAFRRLNYETKLTLEEAGLLNCLVSIEWL